MSRECSSQKFYSKNRDINAKNPGLNENRLGFFACLPTCIGPPAGMRRESSAAGKEGSLTKERDYRIVVTGIFGRPGGKL